MFVKLCAVLGSLTACVTAVRFLRFIYLYTRPSTFRRYVRPGAWALVTGSTNGMGLAFAHQFAHHGLNVIIHGRNAEKLERVRKELTISNPNILVRALVADASDALDMKKNIEAMTSALSDLPGPLTVLVNNVGGLGMIPGMYRALENYSHADVDEVIDLNLRFTTQLTRSLLPILGRSTPSLILNTGSFAGISGVPCMAAYSGVKAYIHAWSVALTRELKLRATNIDCLGLIVANVTETSHLKEPSSFMVPDATTFAKSALSRVGCGRPLIVPYIGHAFLHLFVQSMFEPLQSLFFRQHIADEIAKQGSSKEL